MSSALDAQLESVALQYQYRTARDRMRVWSAGMDAVQAVTHWYENPSQWPDERRVELLELREMAEHIIDEGAAQQLDETLGEKLNRDLMLVARDVRPVDPLSADLAEQVAQSLFRARHNLRLEMMSDKWQRYVNNVLAPAPKEPE